jgi:lysyl endopeptidase
MHPAERSSQAPLLVRSALCIAIAAFVAPAFARQGEPPYSLAHPAKRNGDVPLIDVGRIDAAARRAEADAAARGAAAPTKRLATADGIAVAIDSDKDGAWTLLPDGSRLWRVRVRASGATDLRFDFSRFALPAGASVYVIATGDYYQGPYTAADASAGAFHSPVVPGDTATIELRLPAGARADAGVAISRVGAGFRDLFKRLQDTGLGTSGPCNVNVACPLGQPYPNEIRAVAYYEYDDDSDHQTYICSGTLLADVPHDRRNYFLTAAHCVSSASEAASMVVYWNYQSTVCSGLGEPAGGYLNDDQHGATLRATRADADFALVELSQAPDAAWNVYYAGWDASGAVPIGTIGIHHPSGDVKKITAGPMPGTIDNCIGTGGTSSNTHWETGPYSQGTTEGGSSGSGLFVKSGNGGAHDRLLIGTLSGGYAACSLSNPSQPNNETDCYGKLASGWSGTSASTRLRDWLDPAGTGALTSSGNDSQPEAPTLGHSHHRRPVRPVVSTD